VAYGTVLQDKRKALHERTAQAIESLYHEQLEGRYSELAHHYTLSGNTKKAVEYLHLAGEQAVQRSANEEAIRYLNAAIELLKTLPDTPERARQELTLQITLGPAWMAVKSYAAPEVGKTYARARELCRQMGETPQLFSVLVGLRRFSAVRAEYKKAREFGEQLLSLAQSAQDPALLLEAYAARGSDFFYLGEFVSAREHLEQGITLYNPQEHRSHAFLYGIDPGVLCLTYAASVSGLFGYSEQALKRRHEALTLAGELSHPFSLAFALSFGTWLPSFYLEWRATQERAEAILTLSTEHGFPLFAAWGTMLRGFALAEQGQGVEGIAQMRQGLAAYRATGMEMHRSYFLARLGEMYGKVGQAEEGLTVLAEALDTVHKTGERHYEAELYRLKGQLTLQKEARGWRLETSPTSPQASNLKPPVSREVEQEAEECFLKAIEIARKQQAKSLELRATVSLARLWQQQAMRPGARITHHETRTKLDAARNALSAIYGWFTEGFDTADLKEAKALLEELNH
jgi:predicted ATPase